LAGAPIRRDDPLKAHGLDELADVVVRDREKRADEVAVIRKPD